MTTFRGADGRSLARALILLLVVAGGFSAFHSGRMAANIGSSVVVCAAAGGVVIPGQAERPVSRGHCICCALGCGGTALAALPAGTAQPEISRLYGQGSVFVATSVVVAFKWSPNAAPRGPPVVG